MSDGWPDAPIDSKRQDAFDRAPYAARAADLIRKSHSWDDSIVFGLTGPWGSGKSSMLAMIIEELQARNDDWHVARFTPWATSDVSGMLGDFYGSLSSALPNDKRKKLRKALGAMAKISVPAAKLPGVAGAVAGVLGKTIEAATEQEPWDVSFRTAAEILRKAQKPVLIVADDIDRLQAGELLVLLKVVRLLGRFPGVQYLLAYDDETLFQNLSRANLTESGTGAAARFMEKIVQYPLVVPPLLQQQLLSRLNTGVADALNLANRPAIHGTRLADLVEVYLSLLATPRAIDRFLAQLRHHLPLVSPDEIDDEDVIVLTLLRVAFPSLYTELPRWKMALLRGYIGDPEYAPDVEPDPFEIDPLLEKVPDRSRDHARILLETLFPNLKALNSSAWGGHQRRIHESPYFDRYFTMGVPSHDISDAEVIEVFNAAGEGNRAAVEQFLSRTNGERIVLAVEKARQLSNFIISGGDSAARHLLLASTLISLIDQVPREAGPFTDPRAELLVFASDMYRGVPHEEPATLVIDSIRAAPDLSVELLVLRHIISYRVPRPPWLEAAIDDFADRATNFLIENLRQRDDAAVDSNVALTLDFLVSIERIAPLARAIAAELDEGAFEVVDVAARCVTFDQRSDGNEVYEELQDFHQDWFNRLAPSDHDSFYESTLVSVDPRDLTWTNRRAFASGRVTAPPPHTGSDVADPP